MNCRGRLIDTSTPLIMGILNITPDSFFKGSRVYSEKDLLCKVETMLKDGVAIIDIGGVSTRPLAEKYPSEAEELSRIIPAIDCVKKNFPDLILSIDTFRSGIAREVVVNHDVSIINDISGGSADNEMYSVVASLKVPYVLTHMQGTLNDMFARTNYTDFLSDIVAFFAKKIAELSLMGCNDIILDPGFGFSKTIEQNYELLHKLSYLSIFDKPILAGLSRKSMLYKFLDNTPEDCLNATAVANTLALERGASILRVHDVKEAKEAVTLFMAYKKR